MNLKWRDPAHRKPESLRTVAILTYGPEKNWPLSAEIHFGIVRKTYDREADGSGKHCTCFIVEEMDEAGPTGLYWMYKDGAPNNDIAAWTYSNQIGRPCFLPHDTALDIHKKECDIKEEIVTEQPAKGEIPREFDEHIFQELCKMQCTWVEIKAVLKCGDLSLKNWCLSHYGRPFEELYAEFSSEGKASLRRNQFKLSNKNVAMSIWLGKQYLGQRDKEKEEQSDPHGLLKTLGDYIKLSDEPDLQKLIALGKQNPDKVKEILNALTSEPEADPDA